jgi:hypothetical protein
MREATRILASLLGVFAGIGGPEHGVFEIIRGNVRPETIVFASMGPPCQPEEVWHACEPAMSVIPNYLVTGILDTIVGLAVIAWSAAFVHRKHGGLVLILLSIALLLVGGGLFPPLIGVVAGVIGTRINAPIQRQPTRLTCLGRKPYPTSGTDLSSSAVISQVSGSPPTELIRRVEYAQIDPETGVRLPETGRSCHFTS